LNPDQVEAAVGAVHRVQDHLQIGCRRRQGDAELKRSSVVSHCPQGIR